MPITVAKKKTLGNAKTRKTSRNSKKDKNGDEDLGSNLARVSYIQYPITFQKQSVSALLNSKSEINAIYTTFAKQLGLPIRLIDVEAQKIDGTMLDTYEIVVVAFLVMDKANQVRLFEETYLVANISPEIVFGISCLTLSGADIDFLDWELW